MALTSRSPLVPLLAASVAAGSLALFGWYWMRYSYRWDLDIGQIVRRASAERNDHFRELVEASIKAPNDARASMSLDFVKGLWFRRWPGGAYVRTRGVVTSSELSASGGTSVIRSVADPSDPQVRLWVRMDPERARELQNGQTLTFVGRVAPQVIAVDGPIDTWLPCIDTRARRIGLSGVATLAATVALLVACALVVRRWARDRRAAAMGTTRSS